MNYRHLLLIGLMSLLSAPSFAFHCPMDMKKINAALTANPPVNSQQLAQVRDLRAKGEAYHRRVITGNRLKC
ncbi:MAG: hypothetical protein AAES65_10925 [Candidatus Thiodiazotropha sp. (ex. Lucinoma kazani)]